MNKSLEVQPNHGLRFRAFLKIVFLASLVLTLAGCAGIPPTLPPETRAKIERTEAHAYLPQNEIVVQFMPANYGAGMGLVGAIVDLSVNSALAKGAEGRAKQLRETVGDLDVRAAYWQGISNAVAETGWLKLQSILWRATNVARPTADAARGHAVLNLGTSYTISPDTRVLQMTTGLDFFAQGKPKKPAASVLMTSHSAEIGPVEGDKALALWAENGGAAYRRAIQEAIQENAKLIRHALDLMSGNTNTVHRPMKIKAKTIHGRAEFGIPTGRQGLWGALIEDSATRVIFRLNHGPLLSLPRAEVELEAEKSPLAKPAEGSKSGQRK